MYVCPACSARCDMCSAGSIVLRGRQKMKKIPHTIFGRLAYYFTQRQTHTTVVAATATADDDDDDHQSQALVLCAPI